MNHLLNLVKLASSFPKEINLELPNSCVLSSHLSFPRARNLELLCPLFMLAFPQARLFFPRTKFGSFDGLLKKVRFYGQLTQKNTYSTKSQSTAKPNNVPFSWHIYRGWAKKKYTTDFQAGSNILGQSSSKVFR